MTTFTIDHHVSAGPARVGVLHTSHGSIETPAFMPVGTLGTVKGLGPDELQACGYQLLLSNAYHLYLRPGHHLIQELGGLHRFTAWPGAVLTDSGGFQILSLADSCTVTDDGVTFKSHLDGSLHAVTPELAVEIQVALGADILMILDHCLPYPSSRGQVLEALRRTSRWAARAQRVPLLPEQVLFAIVQGGHDRELRRRAAQELVELDFAGYALGGLSVGESKDLMWDLVDATVAQLPPNRPRYLMGVGRPEDLVEGVLRGIDLFDCVVPTRHGRTGWLFTSTGRVLIKNARYARDDRPVDDRCGCPVCAHYSRAYLRHLFQAGEMLGFRLNTLHNLWYFAALMKQLRHAIREDRLESFRLQFYAHQTQESDDPCATDRVGHPA